ncbi:MAG: hypothetical protein Q9209_004186 [Squamulea sp. 1 TL-2023]
MHQNPSYDDLLKTVEYLEDKRVALVQHLELVYRTIDQLRQQARHANMLKQGKSIQRMLETPKPPFVQYEERQDVHAVESHATSRHNPRYEELLDTVQYLMDDTKALSQHRSLADRTVQEIMQQTRYACTFGPRPVRKGSTWIGGSWLAPSEDILAPAEKLWQDGNANGALKNIESVLLNHDLTIEEDVNANLMVSTIKRVSGDIAQASKCAEDALVIARQVGDYILASKAQFHRGMCFFGQHQYAQAHFCFAFASYLDGYQEQIEASDEADAEPLSGGISTTRPLDPPKAPGYPFGPPPLEVANPESDPEFVNAIFDVTKAGRQPIEPDGGREDSIPREEFVKYKERVEEQFIEARRTLLKSMQEKISLERHHARQRDAWQDELSRARTAPPRWSQPVRGSVRKPERISDQEIESEARKFDSNGKYGFLYDIWPSAEHQRHPPLYDYLPAKLRQMAVELLLQRSSVANILKDWKAMENYSQQAYNLATYFKWEPYIARCAFWIGRALYHQRDWIGAYEKFEEAEKTNGYYIARKDILHWLRETSKRLEASPEPWSTGPMAVRGENPPDFTPLNTVIEEGEDVPFAIPRNQYPAGRERWSSTLLQDNKQPIHATGTSQQSDHPKHEDRQGSDKFDAAHGAESRLIAASPSARIQRLKSHPEAIKLPSIVEPPRIRTPRIYEPQPSGDLGVARQGVSSLPELHQSQATASMVDEELINANRASEHAGEETSRASPSDQTAFPEDIAGQAYQQPVSPASLSPTLIGPSSQTANESDVQIDQDLSPLSANSTTTLPATFPPSSQSPTQSPIYKSHQEPPPNIPLPPSPPPSQPPETALDKSPQPSQTPNSPNHAQLKSALLAHRLLEDEKIEAAIRDVKAAASPRVASARSASSRVCGALVRALVGIEGSLLKGLQGDMGEKEEEADEGK